MPARPSPTRLLRIGTAAAAAGLVLLHGQAATYLPARGNARILDFTYSVVNAH
ncbi:hypothetical protein [Streptomyces sp. S1D4-20]|uniref:hypothetical protein n=1 Tax=Streptomyces sp. S1D4-20 TaxID=2594462 RepID=UPI0013DEC4EB|nr:hypothetical protein [Streptomyces sp. S1D4-20]